jgi:hypothetical protein
MKKPRAPKALRPRLDGVILLYQAGGVTRSQCLPDDILAGINEACPDADVHICAYPAVVIAILRTAIEEVLEGRWEIKPKEAT